MKIYNKITKELFGFINLEKPTIFRYKANRIRIKFQKYIYLFPQKVYVFGSHTTNGYFEKKAVYYWFLFMYVEINYQSKL